MIQAGQWPSKVPDECTLEGGIGFLPNKTLDQVRDEFEAAIMRTEDPWLRAIPATYIPGQIVKGKVTKITNFGVFVELEPDLEGLLHVSELADHKVEDPHDEVKGAHAIWCALRRTP